MKSTIFSAIKMNKKGKIVAGVISILFAVIIVFEHNTYAKITNILEILNGVILALLAIVFTGYAFFQALMSDKLIENMLMVEKDDCSKLEESNNYYVQTMFLQLICILINIVGLVSAILLKDNLVLDYFNKLCTVLEILYVIVAIYFNIICLLETKSFIFNIYQMFNLHALARIVEKNKKTNE